MANNYWHVVVMKEEKKTTQNEAPLRGFLEVWTISGLSGESKECCCIAKFAFDNTFDATNKV